MVRAIDSPKRVTKADVTAPGWKAERRLGRHRIKLVQNGITIVIALANFSRNF